MRIEVSGDEAEYQKTDGGHELKEEKTMNTRRLFRAGFPKNRRFLRKKQSNDEKKERRSRSWKKNKTALAVQDGNPKQHNKFKKGTPVGLS